MDRREMLESRTGSERPERLKIVILGSKKSKISKSYQMTQNRSGSCLVIVWECFGAQRRIWWVCLECPTSFFKFRARDLTLQEALLYKGQGIWRRSQGRFWGRKNRKFRKVAKWPRIDRGVVWGVFGSVLGHSGAVCGSVGVRYCLFEISGT